MTQQQAPKDFSTEKMPEILPILPLFDAALFPKMVLPLVVMQAESIKLVDEAMSKSRIIGLIVSKKQIQESGHAPEDLHAVGASALILKMAKAEDNKAQLLVQGLGRFKTIKYIKGKPYLQARVEHIQDIQKKDKEIEALMSNLISQFARVKRSYATGKLSVGNSRTRQQDPVSGKGRHGQAPERILSARTAQGD
jgi:ATP-dependent Lon protease